MGLFDSSKSEHKEDSNPASQLFHGYLAKSRYPMCMASCFKDNLAGHLTEDEKVCLAICVDKLHRRYAPHVHEIYDTLKKLPGSTL
jgi:hypothetical protein